MFEYQVLVSNPISVLSMHLLVDDLVKVVEKANMLIKRITRQQLPCGC